MTYSDLFANIEPDRLEGGIGEGGSYETGLLSFRPGLRHRPGKLRNPPLPGTGRDRWTDRGHLRGPGLDYLHPVLAQAQEGGAVRQPFITQEERDIFITQEAAFSSDGFCIGLEFTKDWLVNSSRLEVVTKGLEFLSCFARLA